MCVWVLLDSWRSGQHEGQAFMPICLKRDGRSSVDNDHINKGQKMQSLTLLQNDMRWKNVLQKMCFMFQLLSFKENNI